MKNRCLSVSHKHSLSITFSLILLLSLTLGASAFADDNIPLYENSGEIGYTLENSHQSDYGTVTGAVDMGASADGSVSIGEDGLDANIEAVVGLAAELEAKSKKYGVGDDNINLSAEGQAKLEALLGAEGKINAHIDKNGISIGVDAKAGAYVSASAEATFEANIFGVKTSVNVFAEAHAGALAAGTANVTIGFDGKVKFELGAGVAFGVGASVGMAFDIDASELIERLDLTDMAELLIWVEQFIDDPQQTIDALKNQATDQVMEYVKDKAYDFVDDFIKRRMIPLSDIPDTISEIPMFALKTGLTHVIGEEPWPYGNWYGPGWSGGTKGSIGDLPPTDALDAIAMWHDFAYQIAEEQGEKCGFSERLRIMAMADAIAAEKVSGLYPDPSKWPPPRPSDTEKARRYRDRIEALFGIATPALYNGTSDWLDHNPIYTSYNWITSIAKNSPCKELTPEGLKEKANDRRDEWYKNHGIKNPYPDLENPYPDLENPYLDLENPYLNLENPWLNDN